jgi:hypothetical protein
VVGPKVAERLGVMFLDRVIDSSVAERAHVPIEVVHSYTEEARVGLSRLLDRLAVVTNPEVSTQQPLQDQTACRWRSKSSSTRHRCTAA